MASSHYGKPGNRIPDEMKQRIVELCRQGVSRNDIHRQTGVAAASISGIVKRAGLSFDRSRVAAATEARKVDLKERRTRIIEREYARIEHLQDRREAAEFKTVFKGEYGSEYVKTLDFVPTVDERNIADTISRMVTSVAKLEAVDSDQGVDSAKSLLGQIARGFGLAAESDT